ncbi:MAG TPA: Omp28-related outer membrane protein [Bacteroidales bacterium]
MIFQRNKNWVLALLMAFWALASAAQDTLQSENFENYEAGARLCAQAPANWFTWNNGPGTYEDPFVSNANAYEGNNSLEITSVNDVLLSLGSKTAGRYEVSFYLFIPSDKVGFFGVLQNFNGNESSWGLQCYFDADFQGEINTAGATHYFYFVPEQWFPVKVIIDLDNDNAEIYINENLQAEWQWSTQINGSAGLNQLGALNFFAWNSEQRQPLFYVDEIIVSGLAEPEPPTNLTASLNENNVTLNWDAPINAIPDGYKVYRNGEVLAALVSNTTYLDANVYPATYTYSVKAVYESGLSSEAGPVEVEIEGGVERKLVLLEIATGTWCTYCPGSAMGADDLITNGKKVAVIEYHNDDNYSNIFSDYRNSFYNVPGYPTAHFDGLNEIAAGSATQSMYPTYLPVYEQRIEKLSLFTMDMTITQSGERDLQVTVNAKKVYNYQGANLKLHLVLTESHIPENWLGMDELNYVCREMYPDQNGTTVNFSADSIFSTTYTITVDESYNFNNCELVAFLQNSSSIEVLQADKVSLATLGIADKQEIKLSVYPNPASDKLFVKSETPIRTIEIHDISGRKLLKVTSESYLEQLNVSSLKSGTYLLFVQTEKGMAVRKFVKLK